MAITTYSELQTALSNFSGRSGLTSRLPEFIMLAEQRIKNGSEANGQVVPPLRTRAMLSASDLATVAGTETVALPTGFLEINERLYISGNDRKVLDSLTYAQLRLNYSSTSSGEPCAFSVLGSNLVFAPTPDAIYTIPMSYYALTPLSVSQTTNAVLTNHPDVYLQAALVELFLYAKATERLAVAFDAYASSVKSANGATQAAIFSNATRMRSRVSV